MSPLLQFTDVLTVCWLALCGWWAVRRLAAGERCSVYFLIIIHFVLCGLPLLLDVVVGQPDYEAQPGYYRASREESVALIYCAYVSVVPVIMYLAGRSRGGRDPVSAEQLAALAARMQRMNILLWVLIAMPLVMLLWAPNPRLYLEYGAGALAPLRVEESDFHGIFALTCLLSVLAACGWLLGRGKVRVVSLCAVAPFVAASLWLFGKRSIVALTLLFMVYVLWRRGVLVRGRLLVGGFLAVAIMALVSTTYQMNVRGKWNLEGGIDYDGMRIDYGRDASIKLALERELDDSSRPVLEYRGQSVVFCAFIAVPRAAWPDKPWPYAVYLTAAALDLAGVDYLGWGLTSSWLDEAIADFGWLGLALGPLLLALVCRFGDGSGSTLVEALTVVVGALLMAVDFPAFSVLAFAWFVGAAVARIHRRFRRRAESGPVSLRAAVRPVASGQRGIGREAARQH